MTSEDDGRRHDQIMGRVTLPPAKAPPPPFDPPKPFPERALRDKPGEAPMIENER